ncbi:MAG: glycosyltransferase [Candidatus Eisenbacteria bacterium]|uniref:Glycosyltransferase n=1 Tax=Eiseniibacteriota bacterium TaxID=2212470 RepID=A0A538U304_UNCEI|nr:MAG: glycosyltransferase [Candidatus Eisenbacteria bacterium]
MSAVATVVVVSWNRADLLRRCLPALLAQELDQGRTFDVVVVDNGSVDDTSHLLAEEFPSVRVIRSETNLGFAGGNNAALEHVATPFAVLLNNDAVPEPGWLRALLEPFDQPGGSELAASGSKILFLAPWYSLALRAPRFEPGNGDARRLGVQLRRVSVNDVDVTSQVRGAVHAQEAQFRWTEPAGELLIPLAGQAPWRLELQVATEPTRDPVTLDLGTADRRQSVVLHDEATVTVAMVVDAGEPLTHLINNTGGVVFENGWGADRDYLCVDDGRYDTAADLFFACGNGVAFRTSAGREVGWFDDAFFLYYEDVDLSWRLRSRGWRLRYTPGAVIRHEHQATSSQRPGLADFYLERNRLLTLLVNASFGLAARECLLFVCHSAALFLRCGASREERVRRLRVLGSLARSTPRALARRRSVRRHARVFRPDLERLITPHAEWKRRLDRQS